MLTAPEPPRTPVQHRNHTDGTPCGCWLGEGACFVCVCGAAYLQSEVVAFLHWRCYDCGRIHIPKRPI
jgi:hypothetical protein